MDRRPTYTQLLESTLLCRTSIYMDKSDLIDIWTSLRAPRKIPSSLKTASKARIARSKDTDYTVKVSTPMYHDKTGTSRPNSLADPTGNV